MEKIKQILFIVVVSLIVGLGAMAATQNARIKNLKAELCVADNNIRALERENDSIINNSKIYKLTIDQLNNSKDSITSEINKVRKELKVKDKQLLESAYVESVITKVDTIVLKSEPIKEKVNIDTLIHNDWYSLKLGIKSPDTVVVNPAFKSEKYITTYIKREVINPSKCKILNIFKKRENTVEVNVLEKNPYIINTKNKFIEVIHK